MSYVEDRKGQSLEARLHLAWLKSELKNAVPKTKPENDPGTGSKAKGTLQSQIARIFANKKTEAPEQGKSGTYLLNSQGCRESELNPWRKMSSEDSSNSRPHSSSGDGGSGVEVNNGETSSGLDIEADLSEMDVSLVTMWNGTKNVDKETFYNLTEEVDCGLELRDQNLNINDADFFAGLEELSGAFDELEKLLPEKSEGLPALGFEPWSGEPGNASACRNSNSNTSSKNMDLKQATMEDMNLSLNGSSENSVKRKSREEEAVNFSDTDSLNLDDSSGRQSMGKILRSQEDVVSSTRDINPLDLLVSVAKAIVAGDRQKASEKLEKLHEVASIYGDASQRLSAYFLEGLTARLAGKMPNDEPSVSGWGGPRETDCNHHLMEAFLVLLQASPYITFGQVAVNCCILEASSGAEKLHIVDFGVGHGLHWDPLMKALSSRPGGAPSLRITGVDLPAPTGNRAYCLIETGARLKKLADKLNLPFEFDCVPSKLEDVTVNSVEVRHGEVLVVNSCLRLSQLVDDQHQRDSENPRSVVLRVIRELSPSLFTMVEQHTNHNSPFFLARFYEALFYYAAVFDSLGASLPSDLPQRRLFEQQVLGKAIVNVLACEGQNRIERQEPLSKWQDRIRQAGFSPQKLTKNVENVILQLLKTYRHGYGVKMEYEGSLSLTWQEKCLLDMSAWIPS